MTDGIATTRLKAQSYIIKRPRLTKLLDESEARIILLCAPAGYGKTTLARQWVELGAPVTLWYSARPADSDAAALASGLARLFADGVPERQVVATVEDLAAQGQGADSLAQAIMQAIPVGDWRVVVDDYHYITASPEADALLLDVVAQTSGRFLLTTRSRPQWLSARRLVYRDVFLVEQADLAFTEPEAQAVLNGRSIRDDVVEIADGWPAVIGMAAVQGGGGSVAALAPRALYEFFVEDLFGNASQSLQDGLLVLAAGGDASIDVARDLLGDTFDEVLQGAAARGFISYGLDAKFTLHPLLRDFLLTRLAELGQRQASKVVAPVITRLRVSAWWDDCLTTLQRFPETEAVTETLKEALPDLLHGGRIATVRRWLELGKSVRSDDPIFLLAAAEVAVREGRNHHAQELAENAAGSLKSAELAARAQLVAARAAHLQEDMLAASSSARRAHALATVAETKQEALWLAFIASLEGQLPEVDEDLQALRNTGPSNARFALRVACAEALHSYEVGQIRRALAICERAEALLPHVEDPLQRTAFLNVFAHFAFASAEYARSLEVADILLEEARAAGLEFPVSYGLMTRANVLASTRKVGAARRLLDDLQRRPKLPTHVAGSAILCAAKIRITGGDLARASAELDVDPPSGSQPHFVGELAAYRGLVYASRGLVADAESSFKQAEDASRYVETATAVTLGRATAALVGQRRDAATVTKEAVSSVLDAGARDIVVTAARAYPDLISTCARTQPLARRLTTLLNASGDLDIARHCGLPVTRELTRGGKLSKRERDVYELMAQGLTNRQIASALFISEATTKVHVHHIFEKLGVRSRAEVAALLRDDG